MQKLINTLYIFSEPDSQQTAATTGDGWNFEGVAAKTSPILYALAATDPPSTFNCRSRLRLHSSNILV